MEIRFNAGQKIYYVKNARVYDGVIQRINIDNNGVIYELNDGYYHNAANYAQNTTLKEHQIFLTIEDAKKSAQLQTFNEIKEEVGLLNKRLKDASIKARVVIENV